MSQAYRIEAAPIDEILDLGRVGRSAADRDRRQIDASGVGSSEGDRDRREVRPVRPGRQGRPAVPLMKLDVQVWNTQRGFTGVLWYILVGVEQMVL